MNNCKICNSPVKIKFNIPFDRLNREDMVSVPTLPVEDEWSFYECTWCHALQTSAMDNLTTEELSTFYQYNDTYIPKSRNRAHRAVRFLDRALKMFPQKGKKLLSYGAGISKEPEMFQKLGYDVDTCDFGEQFTFTPDNFSKIKTKYNIISSMEVLEHLVHPKETLNEILKHLETDGVFIASTGLWSRLSEELRTPNWWYVRHATEGHIFIWTLQALDIMAKQNNCILLVLNKEYPLCTGMGGSGQYPIFIIKR